MPKNIKINIYINKVYIQKEKNNWTKRVEKKQIRQDWKGVQQWEPLEPIVVQRSVPTTRPPVLLLRNTQTDIDEPIRCSPLTLEREEHL
jgi:hypothetical protein